MSDYRNPNDPTWRDSPYDPNVRTGASGWIAGTVFLVIILGLAFGVGHMPNRGNNNPNNTTVNNTSVPATQPAPSGPATRTYSPTPMSPEQNPAPTSPGPAQP